MPDNYEEKLAYRITVDQSDLDAITQSVAKAAAAGMAQAAGPSGAPRSAGSSPANPWKNMGSSSQWRSKPPTLRGVGQFSNSVAKFTAAVNRFSRAATSTAKVVGAAKAPQARATKSATAPAPGSTPSSPFGNFFANLRQPNFFARTSQGFQSGGFSGAFRAGFAAMRGAGRAAATAESGAVAGQVGTAAQAAGTGGRLAGMLGGAGGGALSGAALAGPIGLAIIVGLKNIQKGMDYEMKSMRETAHAFVNKDASGLMHAGVSHAQGFAQLAGGPILGTIGAKLIGVAHSFIDGMDSIVASFGKWNAATARATAIYEAHQTIFSVRMASALGPLMEWWVNLKTKVLDMFSAYMLRLINIFKAAWDIGKALLKITGIWQSMGAIFEGMKATFKWLEDAMKALVNSILDAATAVLKIAAKLDPTGATQSMIDAIDKLRKAINGGADDINKDFAKIRANFTGAAWARPAAIFVPRHRGAGGFAHFASGGMAGGTDTVPAMLTPGEFVVKASAAKMFLPALHAMNRYAGGGIVNPLPLNFQPFAGFGPHGGGGVPAWYSGASGSFLNQPDYAHSYMGRKSDATFIKGYLEDLDKDRSDASLWMQASKDLMIPKAAKAFADFIASISKFRDAAAAGKYSKGEIVSRSKIFHSNLERLEASTPRAVGGAVQQAAMAAEDARAAAKAGAPRVAPPAPIPPGQLPPQGNPKQAAQGVPGGNAARGAAQPPQAQPGPAAGAPKAAPPAPIIPPPAGGLTMEFKLTQQNNFEIHVEDEINRAIERIRSEIFRANMIGQAEAKVGMSLFGSSILLAGGA